jgi:4-diphosphocytidyl-2-C-methyl-D-erythritol kinase
MISFPNGKINLGLKVLSKRPDGYHNIQSIFYPVDIKDALEIVPRNDKKLNLFVSGMAVNGPEDSNLCLKAYYLLQQQFDLPGFDIHLLKGIPAGAGLGGGSSDGTSMLKLLNNYCELGLSDDELLQNAMTLGSDCGFFVQNKPAMVGGRGEQITLLDLPLAGSMLILITSDIHISTAESFANVKPDNSEFDPALLNSTEMWQEILVNDFERHAFDKSQELAEVKTTLLEKGAFYASMTGTGSAIYGLFRQDPVDLELPSKFSIHRFML